MPLQPPGDELHSGRQPMRRGTRKRRRDWTTLLGGEYIAKKGPAPSGDKDIARDENGRFTSGPGMAKGSDVKHLEGGEHAIPQARASDVRHVKDSTPMAHPDDVQEVDEDLPMAHDSDVKLVQPPRLPSQRHNQPARKGPPGVAARMKAQDQVRRLKVQKSHDWSGLREAANWQPAAQALSRQIKKENRLGALWQDLRETFGGARRPPHPMAHSVAKARVDPDYLAAQSLIAITDRYMGEGHAVEYANDQALVAIEKDADNADLRLGYTRWPAGPDGMDIHIGSGQDRAPGYVGVDLYPYDHGTCVHDLNLSIPFPDACARSVMVTKALAELTEDVPALVDEINRVLAPGGAVVVPPGWPSTRVRGYIAKELGAEFRVGTSTHGTSFVPRQPQHEVPEIVLKEDGGAPILKAWPTERIIYSVVLEPDFTDAHNDTMRAEDIQKTAHSYIQDCRVVAHRHGRSIDAHPVESYIAPQDLKFDGGPYGDQVVKKGSWVVGLKINDPECWDKVLSGEFTGVSIGGRGSRRAL